MKFCAFLILSLLTVLFTNRRSKIISVCYAIMFAFYFYISIFLGDLGLISLFVEKIIGEGNFNLIYNLLYEAADNIGISYSAYELVQFTLTALILVVSFRLVVEIKPVKIKAGNILKAVRNFFRVKISHTKNVMLWGKRHLVCQRLRC